MQDEARALFSPGAGPILGRQVVHKPNNESELSRTVLTKAQSRRHLEGEAGGGGMPCPGAHVRGHSTVLQGKGAK